MGAAPLGSGAAPRQSAASVGAGRIAEAALALALSAEAASVPVPAIEALLLAASLFPRGSAASRAAFDRALALALPEGVAWPFAEAGDLAEAALGDLGAGAEAAAAEDLLGKALAAAGRPARGKAGGGTAEGPVLVERPSGRELAVLRLIARGLTYEAVAERLFVSLNTVRSHVRALYGKLGADNKVAAIARARSLGLID